MGKIKQSFSASKLFLKKYQKLGISLGIIGTVFNILFFQSTNSLALLFFLAYWLIIGAVYQISEKFFFTLALICLVLTVPPFLLNHLVLAERFSVWEFLFIMLALWQWLYLELRDKISKR